MSCDQCNNLLGDIERLASSVAGLRRVILDDTPGVAADLATVIEHHACDLAERRRAAQPNSGCNMQAARPATCGTPFMPCNAAGAPLFALRAGVDTTDALSAASSLLGAALDSSRTIAAASDSEAAFGVVYLIEMAKAVVDGAIGGNSDGA